MGCVCVCGGGGGAHVGCRLKLSTFVGEPQLTFLSLVVTSFFLVLSGVSKIFHPFVASRLTSFRPSKICNEFDIRSP